MTVKAHKASVEARRHSADACPRLAPSGQLADAEAPGEGEYQTYLYDDETDSGFVIRNEGNGLFKAEEWRDGDIADITYGPYAEMKAWTESESSTHNAWRAANGYGSLPLRTLSELYRLWDALRDVPVTEDGRNLDGAFLHFSKGVETESVWRWFEAQNPNFIVGDVQRGIRHAASNQESATVSQVARTPWERDDVQFPRLLAEILATQDSLDKKALADSMGLSVEQVSSLFDRAAATWEAFKAESALEANGDSSARGLTEVRKSVLQYTVLHDDDIDLSTMSLEEIGQACREGGYIGGDLTVVADEHLTQSQLDVEAAKLGADPTFFCIEDGDEAPASPSFEM
ncbi:hypothetical protein ACUXIL_003405 [Ralstonia pickettii]|nr:hypothetical protein [Ralstonia pickettii]MBA9852083.1 hypothetical protein [Ralstonia pickettii]MBA9919902.1 hypothetical protein [Ralstonia pickettii]MBA9959004.1 hypothetical protein [Ralstonia pickettii]MBA9964617.1 hypothetical protein [Ralstonia pickettii]